MPVFVGDIGGTNTRLIYADVDKNECKTLFEKNYLSKDYKSFTDVLQRFVSDFGSPHSINTGCFVVAGSVEMGKVAVTNLPWIISEDDLIE